MTDDTCPSPDGLDETACLALAVIFGRVCDATSSPAVQMWAHSCEDRLLGYDEPSLPLDALADAELCAVHSLLVVAMSACDDKRYRQWVVDLGRMITHVLQVREAEQTLIDAKAAAMDAEEQRIAREGRPPENLAGLPTWSELTGPPKPDGRVGVKVTPLQGFRRVVVVALSAARRMLAGARRSSGYESERR